MSAMLATGCDRWPLEMAEERSSFELSLEVQRQENPLHVTSCALLHKRIRTANNIEQIRDRTRQSKKGQAFRANILGS